jgi:tRNA(Arg) A34 adenosine deaminase TadA
MDNELNNIIYPYLPEGWTISYVPENNPFLQEAKKFSLEHSTDLNHPTGAVVVKDAQILGYGANCATFKQKWFTRLHGKGVCFRKWLKVKSGTKYWVCPGCVTNKNHAEASAIRDAIKKYGAQKVGGADLYLWGHWWCCKPCFDSIIAAGIINVYLMKGSEEVFK